MKNKKKVSRPTLHSVEEGHGSNASPFACMVPGCHADVPEHLQYSRRRRICQQHLKAPAVAIDGQAHRFCQQCGRFQLLSEFSDERRSCDAALRAHNARRRISWTSRKTQPAIAKHSASHGVARWNGLLSAGLQQAPWFPAAHQPAHSTALLAGAGSSSSAAAGACGSSGQHQILLQQLAWQQLQLQQQQQVLYAQQQFGKCLPQVLAQAGAAQAAMQVELSTAPPAVAVSHAPAAGAMTAGDSGQPQQPQHAHSAPVQQEEQQQPQQWQPSSEVACWHSSNSSGVGYTDMQHVHCPGPVPSTHSPSVGSTVSTKDSTDDISHAAADTHGLLQQQQQHLDNLLAAAGTSEQGSSKQRSSWERQCMHAQPSCWLQHGSGSLQGLQQMQDNSRNTQTKLQPQQLQQVQILQQLQSDQGTAHLDALAPVQPSELYTRSAAKDTPEPTCEGRLELSCNGHTPTALQPLLSAAGTGAASEPHAGLIAAGKACATDQGRDAAAGPSSAAPQEAPAADQPTVRVLGHDLLHDLDACVDAFDMYDLARLDSASLASFGAIDDLAATTAAAGHEDQLFTEQVISLLLDDGFDDLLSQEPGIHQEIGDFKF